MPDLSPFQTLPIHIAEAVAFYCIGMRHNHLRHDNHIIEKSKKTWLVLHDVSRSWMQLARRNLNDGVTLKLTSNCWSDKFVTTLHSRSVIERRTSIIPHVKYADISLENIVWKPNNGGIEKLERVWPEDLVFTKARSLICYLLFSPRKISKNARNDFYFKWFVARVRSSFPNLQQATIRFMRGGKISISPDVLYSKEWNASLFLSALFRIRMWTLDEATDSAFMDNEHILIQNVPELTSFGYVSHSSDYFASRAVKLSAKSLEKLSYIEEGSEGFKGFMFNDDGQVIVYPRLRDLYVGDFKKGIDKFTTDRSIIPFPALQHLRIHSSCIFKDDTLFRGSTNTLVSLDIGLHPDIVDIFRKYKVFTQGAYPNILHVSATLDCYRNSILPADEFVVAAFELISPATQSMSIIGDNPYQRISSVIPTCPYLENIQILHLEKAELSVLEILDVLKSIPPVTDFGCRFQGIDSELNAIQDRVIPSHLGTQYFKFNSRLKFWRAHESMGASHGDIAVLLVTLAVVCPNFTFVTGWIHEKVFYLSKIAYILSSGLYDEHAERLGHIFDR